jgi:hypothetical protein
MRAALHPVAALPCAPLPHEIADTISQGPRHQSASAPHEVADTISRGSRRRSLTLAAVLPTMLAKDGSS